MTVNNTAEVFKATNMDIYLSPGVPMTLKMLLVSIFIPFGLPILYLPWQTTADGLKNLRKATPFAVSIVCWGFCLLLAAISDKTSMNDTQPKIRSIEEILEFTAAVYALTAVILYSKHSRQNDGEAPA